MMPTSSHRIHKIEAWFHDHQDGEFVVLPSEHRSSVQGDRTTSRTVIYTTKAHCLGDDLRALGVAHPVSVVGRCGLPMPIDLIHLDGLPVGATCCFLGDADPPDLLAFVWLREHVKITWLGVNDELLDQNPIRDPASLEIAMSEAEKLAMRTMPDFCPDFRDLLGPYCSATLDRGLKIELEAAVIGLRSRFGR